MTVIEAEQVNPMALTLNHFADTLAQPIPAEPDHALAASVLRQAAGDLRRFKGCRRA